MSCNAGISVINYHYVIQYLFKFFYYNMFIVNFETVFQGGPYVSAEVDNNNL